MIVTSFSLAILFVVEHVEMVFFKVTNNAMMVIQEMVMVVLLLVLFRVDGLAVKTLQEYQNVHQGLLVFVEMVDLSLMEDKNVMMEID